MRIMRRDDALRRIAGLADELRARHSVHSIAIFGSVARDEARSDSDVDLLVEFSAPVGLIAFNRLRLRLEEALGAKVDLVTPAALRQSMREDILREAIRAA